MNNIYKIAFSGFALLVCISACSDFVDIQSPTVVRQDLYFTNQADFTAAVNGLYSGLRDYYDGFYQVGEIPSDNAEINGYNLGTLPMDQLTWFPSTGAIEARWSSSYTIIARSNTILEKMEGFQMDEALKTQYSGEAKFIRALMYFYLVQLYGDVPLVLTVIQTEEEAYSYSRTAVQEVYDQIESDLLSAVESLPDQYNSDNIGRVTKGAAQSLLGKVYVTQREFEKAIPMLSAVVNSETYGLLPDYAEVFSVDNKNNEEIVFDIQYLGGAGYGEGSNFSISFAPFGSGTEVTSGGQPGSANSGTLDLFNAFEAGDKRKNVAINLWPSSDSLFYTRKFLDQPIAANEGNNNWPVIRYPDVLLLLAEALNETGAVNEALGPVNEVRARAGLAIFEINSLDQQGLREAIQRERRVELSFEGHRWFDLLRTETMLSTMRAYKEKYADGGGYLVGNYEVTDNKVLFPIPFREISLNPNLEQNPGY